MYSPTASPLRTPWISWGWTSAGVFSSHQNTVDAALTALKGQFSPGSAVGRGSPSPAACLTLMTANQQQTHEVKGETRNHTHGAEQFLSYLLGLCLYPPIVEEHLPLIFLIVSQARIAEILPGIDLAREQRE